MTATDATTLARVEMVMNLLLLGRFSAASIAADAQSEDLRLQAGLLGSALDEALAEQRILWLKLATGPELFHGYLDVAGHEISRLDATHVEATGSGVFVESAAQLAPGDDL